jgi:hypothetical protein
MVVFHIYAGGSYRGELADALMLNKFIRNDI